MAINRKPLRGYNRFPRRGNPTIATGETRGKPVETEQKEQTPKGLPIVSTYTQTLYHIVFTTKNREPVLAKERRDDLYKYIWGILRKRDCHLYRIGGVEDHIHILCSLHPSVALADLVKEVKVASSHWIKTETAFPAFGSWQGGYGAFTCSINSRDRIIEYIKNQEQHHHGETSATELKRLLADAGIEYDQTYFE